MAFNVKPAATLTFTLRDATGSKSFMSFDIPSGTLASVALIAADGMRGLLANVTGCAILAQSLVYSQVDDVPAQAVAGSRVERKGAFVYRTAAGKLARYEVPGIEPALVLADGAIDRSNVSVIALIGAMVAADAVYSDSNGSDLRSIAEAYEVYRTTKTSQLPSRRLS